MRPAVPGQSLCCRRTRQRPCLHRQPSSRRLARPQYCESAGTRNPLICRPPRFTAGACGNYVRTGRAIHRNCGQLHRQLPPRAAIAVGVEGNDIRAAGARGHYLVAFTVFSTCLWRLTLTTKKPASPVTHTFDHRSVRPAPSRPQPQGHEKAHVSPRPTPPTPPKQK